MLNDFSSSVNLGDRIENKNRGAPIEFLSSSRFYDISYDLFQVLALCVFYYWPNLYNMVKCKEFTWEKVLEEVPLLKKVNEHIARLKQPSLEHYLEAFAPMHDIMYNCSKIADVDVISSERIMNPVNCVGIVRIGTSEKIHHSSCLYVQAALRRNIMRVVNVSIAENADFCKTCGPRISKV